MIVSELREKIEDMFPVGDSTDGCLSVTGEPYAVIGYQADRSQCPRDGWGTVYEGNAQEWGFDEETACHQAWRCFLDYAQNRKGVLYWRAPPRLEWNESKARCVIYMRCLVSDAPHEGDLSGVRR